MNCQKRNSTRPIGYALDRASVRTVDENGFLHVASSHITKAGVNPYYGREVPGGVEHGYQPDAIYYGFRSPEELQKSLPTWAGLPIHAMHHMDYADAPQKATRVGAVGTDVVWGDPYVDAPLTIWDGAAIDAIEAGTLRELSCAYKYETEFTAGKYEGMPYDFIMRDIQGNHVALVEEGRAGPDVLVADSNSVKAGDTMENVIQTDGEAKTPLEAIEIADAPTGADAPADVEQQEVDLAQAIIDLHKIDPATGEIVDIAEDDAHAGELKAAFGDLTQGMPPEKLARIANALKGLAFVKPMAAPEEVAVAPEADAAPEAPAESPAVVPAPAGRDEEFKSAMDKCGVDANDPGQAKAFAEGVAYGEGQKESAPAPADAEAVADPEPITETVSEDCQEKDPLRKRRRDSYDSDLGADCQEKDPLRKRRGPGDSDLGAQDANSIREAAVKQTKAEMKALFKAVGDVRPIAGNLDPMAFDSASDVYGEALRAKGYDPAAYPRDAWKAMVDVVLRETVGPKAATPAAQDAAPKGTDFDGCFAGLGRISIN